MIGGIFGNGKTKKPSSKTEERKSVVQTFKAMVKRHNRRWKGDNGGN